MSKNTLLIHRNTHARCDLFFDILQRVAASDGHIHILLVGTVIRMENEIQLAQLHLQGVSITDTEFFAHGLVFIRSLVKQLLAFVRQNEFGRGNSKLRLNRHDGTVGQGFTGFQVHGHAFFFAVHGFTFQKDFHAFVVAAFFHVRCHGELVAFLGNLVNAQIGQHITEAFHLREIGLEGRFEQFTVVLVLQAFFDFLQYLIHLHKGHILRKSLLDQSRTQVELGVTLLLLFLRRRRNPLLHRLGRLLQQVTEFAQSQGGLDGTASGFLVQYFVGLLGSLGQNGVKLFTGFVRHLEAAFLLLVRYNVWQKTIEKGFLPAMKGLVLGDGVQFLEEAHQFWIRLERVGGFTRPFQIGLDGMMGDRFLWRFFRIRTGLNGGQVIGSLADDNVAGNSKSCSIHGGWGKRRVVYKCAWVMLDLFADAAS